jgi:hypothetical protein
MCGRIATGVATVRGLRRAKTPDLSASWRVFLSRDSQRTTAPAEGTPGQNPHPHALQSAVRPVIHSERSTSNVFPTYSIRQHGRIRSSTYAMAMPEFRKEHSLRILLVEKLHDKGVEVYFCVR